MRGVAAGKSWILVVATVAVAGIVAVVVAIAVIYSGVINISALHRENALTRWVLHNTMEKSVERRAARISVPASHDQETLREGFSHFREMCVTCHGAPGIERSEIGKGLRPRAPDLAEAGEELSEAEVYWIVGNGIRMTGMPAFAPTHNEKQLWGLAAFVRGLHRMSPQEYAERVRSSRPEDGHSHHH